MADPLEAIGDHMPFEITPNHAGVVKAIYDLAKQVNAIGLDPAEFNMIVAYLVGCNGYPTDGETGEHKKQIFKAFEDGYAEFGRWYLLTQTECQGSA